LKFLAALLLLLALVANGFGPLDHFVGHLDLAFEEGPFGDHHPGRGYVSLQATGGQNLDSLNPRYIALDLAADLYGTSVDLSSNSTIRADHDLTLKGDFSFNLTLDHQLGRA
jgi:hypothetical protein